MELTKENKDHINSLSVYDLLYKNRFAPVGEKWFQGETGKYWLRRMNEVRAEDPGAYVAASKHMGW